MSRVRACAAGVAPGKALRPHPAIPIAHLQPGAHVERIAAAQRTDHRALHDARATVDVLHALLGRLGGRGVTTLEELLDFRPQTDPEVRSRRSLAHDLPSAPSKTYTPGADRRPLHVGTSGDIRRRW